MLLDLDRVITVPLIILGILVEPAYFLKPGVLTLVRLVMAGTLVFW